MAIELQSSKKKKKRQFEYPRAAQKIACFVRWTVRNPKIFNFQWHKTEEKLPILTFQRLEPSHGSREDNVSLSVHRFGPEISQQILHGLPWIYVQTFMASPEDESPWPYWSPDFSSTATRRSVLSLFQWNISWHSFVPPPGWSVVTLALSCFINYLHS